MSDYNQDTIRSPNPAHPSTKLINPNDQMPSINESSKSGSPRNSKEGPMIIHSHDFKNDYSLLATPMINEKPRFQADKKYLSMDHNEIHNIIEDESE